MLDAVERTTWAISPAFSGEEILPCSAACLPSEPTSSATPAWVGVDSLVEPPEFGVLNSAWGPKLVSLERLRKVVTYFDRSTAAELMSLGCRPLPGHAWAQNIPVWWSEESKSFDAAV